MLKPDIFFNIPEKFSPLFKNCDYVWQSLSNIKLFFDDSIFNLKIFNEIVCALPNTIVFYNNQIIKENFQIDKGDAAKNKLIVTKDGVQLEGASVIYAGASIMSKNIYMGKGSVIEPGAYINGPVYIGDNTEIRQGAYIRGNAIIGDKCVVGHCTEIKNSIMLGESKAGHFAYIGDSVLGKVNLGAGTKLANLKIVKDSIRLKINGKIFDTGLRKFGAILSDGVETGCNSVTSPGTIMGKNSLLYPNTTARAYYEENTIIKHKKTFKRRN